MVRRYAIKIRRYLRDVASSVDTISSLRSFSYIDFFLQLAIRNRLWEASKITIFCWCTIVCNLLHIQDHRTLTSYAHCFHTLSGEISDGVHNFLKKFNEIFI